MKKETIRALSVTGIMSACGFILMTLEFPLPFIIPSFIKFDFSELPALITSFAFGPLYGILVCFVKNLLHMLFFFGSSMGVGELSNFLLGAVFVGVSGAVYKRNRTRKGALIGSVSGAVLMAVISVFTNAFIVYPAYTVIYGMPMDAIIGMYKAILPSANTLIKALLIFNLPFTFFKGILDSAICFIIYKKLSPILKHKRENNC